VNGINTLPLLRKNTVSEATMFSRENMVLARLGIWTLLVVKEDIRNQCAAESFTYAVK
jgi:hypothetical protein